MDDDANSSNVSALNQPDNQHSLVPEYDPSSDESSDPEDDIPGEEDQEEDTEEMKQHPAYKNEPYTWPEDYQEDPADIINIDELEAEAYEEIMHDPFNRPGEVFVPPNERSDVPLAAILHPQLEDIDPRRYFPEFKQGGILRFSRLLSTLSKHKVDPIWWGSKTFKRPGKEKKADQPGLSHENEEGDQNGNSKPIKKELKLEFGEPPPIEDCYTQETSYHSFEVTKKKEVNSDDEESAPWRYGPAKMWYDKMGVPSNPARFDYGMKVKKSIPARLAGRLRSAESDTRKSIDMDDSREVKPFPEETFLPVNLLRWEDDVIIDPETARQQLIEEYSKVDKLPKCGWIPTQSTRTYADFILAWKSGEFLNNFKLDGEPCEAPRPLMDAEKPLGPDPHHSIFPMDNYELEHYRWEDDIIWDPSNMPKIPTPRILTLEYEDDPLLFGIPEDKLADEPKDDDANASSQKPFDRKEHQFTKKSKMILGQVQQRQKQEEEEQMEITTAQITDKDPFNLSNDDYYHPKKQAITTISGSSIIQHSIAAQNIHRTFFPTHLSTIKLRNHHRLPLPRKIARELKEKFTPVNTLTRHIRRVEDMREQQRIKEGGGDIFYMREVQDLSGKDGTLLLVEYSEEHPPFVNQPGMASKIRNYYKRKTNKDQEPEFEFGETAFTHTSPFLGNLQPGECLQAIENNMYRAPIYRHRMAGNDYLLIRTKAGFFIRKCPYLFVAGQECPLYEVPSPNSKRATVFVRDFLLAFIYRLFWASNDHPRRLKMEDIKAAFPHYAESSVRKRLKQCSDFKRLGTGPDQNYWVLKDDFRLPSKEEVLAMVTPEMCCAQYSMLAAEQRLKDAGYGEKYFFTPENEDDSDDQVTMEDEVKCAPWNTTRAYISAMKGKCMLDQTGIADPTGCGQGFSYVRISAKPQKEDLPQMPKRLVTGTNADLRKLPLKEAKEICREYGVKEEEINSLSRWEIIDVIRTLSTQAAKARADFSGMARFARGNIRFNFADMQDKYKKHCQHVFDMQNAALGNAEELSTDEGESGEDSDNEELATKLESMLKGPKHARKVPHPSSEAQKRREEYEDEEKDRMDLQRLIHGEVTKTGATVSKGAKEAAEKNVKNMAADKVFDPNMSAVTGQGPRKLKIYRTFKNQDGTESTRVEVITHPQLIEAYVCLRSTRDEAFIKVYAQMDEQYKEEKRKEKRRLQDQLRRIRRNEMKLQRMQSGHTTQQQQKPPKPTVHKEPKPIKPSLLKMKCSACGGNGHMKTNKNCPLYGKRLADRAAMQQSQIRVEDLITKKPEDEELSGELLEVDGTKIKLSTKIFKKLKQKEKQQLKFSINKNVLSLLEQQKRKEAEEKKSRPKGRPPKYPRPEGQPPGPSTSKPKEDRERSQSIEKIPKEPIEAKIIKFKHFEETIKRRRSTIIEEADYFGPVKSVHRRRADPKVSLATLLMEIFNDVKRIEDSDQLMLPVNPKTVPDYYNIVKNPMDLQTIKTNIMINKYELRRDFLSDLKQILDNSRTYNGDTHPITKAARCIFELASKRIIENEKKLIDLEKSINPLLDDNDMVGFSFILNEIVQQCKNIPKSAAFHTKVDIRKFPNYLEKVKRPMDLGTIEKNIKDHRYTSVAAFRRDVEQIKINSEIYNGPVESSVPSAVYTQKADEILKHADKLIADRLPQLQELEANIKATMEAETGSIISESYDYPERPGTSTSSVVHHVLEVHEESHTFIMDETTQMSMTAMSEMSEQQIMPDELDDMNDEENEIGDVLHDDLALSGEEFDDEDEEEEDWQDADLSASNMNTTGQLAAELAVSDSDEDDDLVSAKRARLDDDLDTL